MGLWTRLAIVPSSPISTRSVAFSSRRLSIDRPAAGVSAARLTTLTPSGGAVVEGQPQRPRRQRRIDDNERVVERTLRQLVGDRFERALLFGAPGGDDRVEFGLGVLIDFAHP